MNKIIEEVKTLINRQVLNNVYMFYGIPFSKYQKFYFSTNENIKGYLNNVDFCNKDKALSVLASGDHLFNLVEKGIKEVDTFDTNLLTNYYVFGLRYAMILKYNYNDYIKVLSILIDNNTSLEVISSIINDLLPYMDNNYRMFWKEINDYNYLIQSKYKTNLNLLYLLSLGTKNLSYITFKNSYLLNEDNYNRLKSNLMNVNTTYKNIDAINLPKSYSDKYDLILLSNIPDYLGKYFSKNSNFKEYLSDLKNMLVDDGILFFDYIYKYSFNNIIRKKLIDYLDKEEHNFINKEIKIIDSDYHKDLKDGVIILRKK